MSIIDSIRRWIDGEVSDDPLAEVDAGARPRRIWEDFLVKVAREVEAVMQREMFTPPGGPTSMDPLRYQREPAPAGRGDEIAFLRWRYKPPRGQQSILRERPITERDAYHSARAAPANMRWAAAVAGYGQLLRNDPWLAAPFGWDEVTVLARSAVGDDPLGLRREFLDLVDSARRTEPSQGD